MKAYLGTVWKMKDAIMEELRETSSRTHPDCPGTFQAKVRPPINARKGASMNFEEQLACLGKKRSYVIERLKKVYPHWDIYKEIHPDKDHEWIVGMCLDTAWRRAASDEFHCLLKARFCRNQWLAPWFQSYIGGVPDPQNILTSKWVYEQLHYNRENVKTSERAREWGGGNCWNTAHDQPPRVPRDR